MVITDRYGNVVLTAYDDARLKKQGYTWQDIAMASNISAYTGEPIYDVLQNRGYGTTWPQWAVRYGVDPRRITDVSCYPFEHSNKALRVRTPIGAGSVCPAYKVEAQPCPQPCPPAEQPVCPPGTQPSSTGTGPMAPVTPPAPTTPSTY